MLSFFFLSIALASLVLCTTATPLVPRSQLISLPIVKVINTTGTTNIVKKDRARIKLFRQDAADAAVDDDPVTNQGVSYTASVGVGTPPTYYNLIVDTGSSNTWVGATLGKPYKLTSTTVPTLELITVEYGSGSMSGIEYTDTVTIGPTQITGQGVGGALLTSGFEGVDGILGLGPVDLTQGTEIPNLFGTIATVTDDASTEHDIPLDLLAVSFEPTTKDPATNGELTFGGVDNSKFTGDITYTPITSTSPASDYWGVDQSITYGSMTIMSTTAGIVDTGTTLIYLPTDAFNAYMTATNASLDSDTGFLSITPAQFAKLEPLNFNVGGTSFPLSPDGQVWPRKLNSVIGGTSDGIYLVIQDSGADAGSGLGFIDGQAFLERFYSVYDTTNKRVGLATTPFTNAMVNNASVDTP